MDFQQLKVLAKEKRCPITDLIVLASANDPFYIGTPTNLKDAEWFADIWKKFDYQSGIHLRRIHYQLISQDPAPLLPDGETYENTKACWKKLNSASKYARYLGLVDAWRFKDRRNPEPVINVNGYKVEPYIDITELGYWEVELDSFPSLPSYWLKEYSGDQKYHIEIWIEKSTMNDVLEPVCQSQGVNLIVGMGEFSITSVVKLMNRLKTYKKPCRILYVSDFDPGGRSMPVAVSRKIEKFLEDSDEPFDVRLIPIILTHEQIQKYELPRTPIKESEKRGTQFEKRFGEGAVELDALEALHPGELKKIVVKAIRQYRDGGLNMRVSEARSQLIRDLRGIEEDVIAEYQEEIDGLEYAYGELENEVAAKSGALGAQVQNVYHAIRNRLEEKQPDLSAYPIPDGVEAEELNGQLFNSERTYLDQLKIYKDFQGKVTRAIKKPLPVVDKAAQDLAIKRAIQQIETQFGKG